MRIEGEQEALEALAHVTATIGNNPELAHPLLQALEAASDDPEALEAIVAAGIATTRAAKDVLPVVPALALEPSIRKQYSDTREGFDPHDAIVFTVKLDRKVSLKDLLVEQLGQEEVDILMCDWGSRVDFNINAPCDSQAMLFLDSSSKARDRNFAATGARTTQKEDLTAAGLDFCDDAQAIVVCATLLKKAREVGLDVTKAASTWDGDQPEAFGKLSAEELDLLTILRMGLVRTRSGALHVHDDGRLRAFRFPGNSNANYWAFGGRSPAE